MDYHLVPPHDHRWNIAEKAIQVFKAYFISILCSKDKSFPLHLWDRLLRQAEQTLNMLRTSRMTPSVSACAYLWGKHNDNANPFAPLGCKVEAPITPGNWGTLAPDTASGFYIGKAWKHYCYQEIYICDTKHTRMCLTAFFEHTYLSMPTITQSDALICAADYPMGTISGVIPDPTCTQDAVDQLMVIFKQQACTANDAATAQRVLREHAQAERVNKEECQMPVQAQVTLSPSLEINENNNIAHTPQNIPQIMQNKNDAPLSANTQQQRETRKQGPSHRNSCYNVWRYQNTRPHSLQNKQLQENTHCSSYVTLPTQSLTTRQATSLSTAVS